MIAAAVKYLQQAQSQTVQDTRAQELVQACSLIKRFWGEQENPTSYQAQGALLIVYALSNNPMEALNNDILDMLIELAQDLEKLNHAQRKRYTEMLFGAGLTLSGHSLLST